MEVTSQPAASKAMATNFSYAYCSSSQVNLRACLFTKTWSFPAETPGILGNTKLNSLVLDRRTRYPGIFLTKDIFV